MLLDAYGKEIRSDRPITDEIASVERDIFRDYMGKIQFNPDKVLKSESGGKGIELYEDLLRDAKVGSTLQTRRLAVTGKEWQVEPASDKRDDVKKADYVEQIFKAINYDAYRRAALSGLVLGVKPAEIMWDYSEGDIFISRIIPRASRRFVFDLDGNMRLLTLGNMIEGEELPPRKFQTFTNPSDNGSPYGDGLGRMLYWPVWFKKNGIKFWLIFCEKFGSPTPWGKYPPGTTQALKDTLLEACESMQQESAIITPDNMSIELIEAARQGSINTYESLCDFMDSQIAQVMLGHTGSSQSTPGKLGSEDAAIDVREDYIKSDADLLCEAENNQMVRWIVDYNFPGVKRNGYPKVWIRTEPEKDLKALAERDKIILVDMGMGKRVSEKYIEDAYGMPLAKDGEATIDVPAPAQQTVIGDLGLGVGNNPVPGKSQITNHKSHSCPCGSTHNFSDSPDDDWIQKYMEALGPSLAASKKAALSEIETWLRSQTAPVTEAEFIAHVSGILGASYAIDAAVIADVTAEIYSAYRLAGLAGTGASMFGGPDLRAMNFLAKVDDLYLSKFIQNPDAVAAVNRFLSEQYLNNGSGLFGRTAEGSIEAFKTLFEQKIGELEDYQVRRIVDTAVQRTRNWAHVAQMNEAAIGELQIVEPTKDCDFCKRMDGMSIPVITAYGRMQSLAAMSAEDYEATFKELLPTTDNAQEHLRMGNLPPYHPHCHGRVIKRTRIIKRAERGTSE